MPRVMISYRNIDGQREFAAYLEKQLASAGIETWIDTKNIPRLSRWENEIFKGIINSDYVILCLSPEYFDSETCLIECYVARGYGKTLIPVVAPYDDDSSIFDYISRHEQTRGIDDLNMFSFKTEEVLGLVEDYPTLARRIINTILNPIPFDTEYEVYFSFRWRQATFATSIADDLNKAGIKSFIHTRSIDAGADWRRISWNAELKAKVHVVILSPDVSESRYIPNEVLVTRTKMNAQFIPILAREFIDDEEAKSTIQRTFATSKNLAVLNDIQWFIPRGTQEEYTGVLIEDIKTFLDSSKT